jgi:hypothetical protein
MLRDSPDPRLDDAANLMLSGALCVPDDRDRMQQEDVDAGESHADGGDPIARAIPNTGAITRANAGTITGANTDDLCRHIE